MLSIIAIELSYREQQSFLVYNWIYLIFSHLYVKSTLDELKGHKVETVMLHKFDLLYFCLVCGGLKGVLSSDHCGTDPSCIWAMIDL